MPRPAAPTQFDIIALLEPTNIIVRDEMRIRFVRELLGQLRSCGTLKQARALGWRGKNLAALTGTKEATEKQLFALTETARSQLLACAERVPYLAAGSQGRASTYRAIGYWAKYSQAPNPLIQQEWCQDHSVFPNATAALGEKCTEVAWLQWHAEQLATAGRTHRALPIYLAQNLNTGEAAQRFRDLITRAGQDPHRLQPTLLALVSGIIEEVQIEYKFWADRGLTPPPAVIKGINELILYPLSEVNDRAGARHDIKSPSEDISEDIRDAQGLCAQGCADNAGSILTLSMR